MNDRSRLPASRRREDGDAVGFRVSGIYSRAPEALRRELVRRHKYLFYMIFYAIGVNLAIKV